jgi:hypothetical protein
MAQLSLRIRLTALPRLWGKGPPKSILGIGSAQQEDRLDRHRRTGVRPAHLQKMSPLMILPTKVNL